MSGWKVPGMNLTNDAHLPSFPLTVVNCPSQASGNHYLYLYFGEDFVSLLHVVTADMIATPSYIVLTLLALGPLKQTSMLQPVIYYTSCRTLPRRILPSSLLRTKLLGVLMWRSTNSKLNRAPLLLLP